jgi:hypothetical protein
MTRRAVLYMMMLPAVLSAGEGAGQVVRRSDAIRTAGEVLCTGVRSKDAEETPLPGATGSASRRWRPYAAGEGSGARVEQGDDGWAAGIGHATVALTNLIPCEFAWTLRGDAFVGRAGAAGAAFEVRPPSIPFGGISENRYLGSIGVFAGGEATRRGQYEPAIAMGRDLFAGAVVRLHVPTQIPLLPDGFIKLNLIGAAQADYAWDDQVRADGERTVAHYTLLVPITLLRFKATGGAYSYERIPGFHQGEALTRHSFSVGITPNRNAPPRYTLRWTGERVGDAAPRRELAFAVHTYAFPLW